MHSSKYAVRNSKNENLSRKQEAERVLSIIGKILILGLLLMQ